MNFSLIFEGIRGGYDGDIAIDDIKVTDGFCAVRETECDFQANSCHFNQVCGPDYSNIFFFLRLSSESFYRSLFSLAMRLGE